MKDAAIAKWSEYYTSPANAGGGNQFPSETLVRLFKGSYLGMPKSFAGMSVLEVGAGNGNNALFLASLGLTVKGTEVAHDICADTTRRLKAAGYDAEFKAGSNRDLPFGSGEFDFLVSWNVLHYEDSEQAIVEALAEYARVLKPGGMALVSTTGPDNAILKDAQIAGAHLYRIGRADDFRKGQIFFYFDHERYIKHYFGQSFADVQVGRIHDDLFSETLDWFLVCAHKAK